MVTITPGIFTTTAQHIQGRVVREYLGIVSGEAVALRRSRTGSAGVRVGSSDLALQHARLRALRTLARRAARLGATVVIGVDFDYVAVGIDRLLVTATGTAVRL
jgi:uncharacterized protein YbjQ (UPF0145 family)